AYERPALFAGNDLPGVMLGTGAQRLLRLYGVRPGERAVVVTTHDGGLDLAEELLAAGIEVSAVADTREADPRDASEARQRLLAAGVLVLNGTGVARARGRRHLVGVDLAAAGGPLQRFNCDLLCLSTGWEPALSLLAQTLPGAVQWDPARSVYSASTGEQEVL